MKEHLPSHPHYSDVPTPPPAVTEVVEPSNYTLRIPKPNWQVTALILVALISAFQTFQLSRLKNDVSAKTVTSAPTSSTSASTAATSSSGSADLQSQVGGC